MAIVAIGSTILAFRLIAAPPPSTDLRPVRVHDLRIWMEFETFGEELQVATYLPTNTDRQWAFEEQVNSGKLSFTRQDDPSGSIGRWRSETLDGQQTVVYEARIMAKAEHYEINPALHNPDGWSNSMKQFLKPTTTVQSTHPEIVALWNDLRPEHPSVLRDLRAIHEFVTHRIDEASFKGTTDALTALRLHEASCNGKSRLFTALARQAGMPTRLIGGLILGKANKRTSHQWVEVFVAGHWVPFCPTNDYFAEIPHTYLELYRGDQSLFVHTRDINFDYGFEITPRLTTPRNLPSSTTAVAPGSGMYADMIRRLGVSHDMSMMLLMFPLATLIVILFRNVIGLQTLGVFLPMLVAASARYMGFVNGIVGFVVLVTIIALASVVMQRLQILHVPRLSVLITMVTLLVIASSSLLPHSAGGSSIVFGLFPVIVVCGAAERIGEMIEKDNLRRALAVMAQTIVVIAFCYMTLSSSVLQSLIYHFPELLLFVIAAQMALGRWTGLRLSEYWRFRSLILTRTESQHETDIGGGLLEIVGLGAGRIHGVNSRNLELLYELNSPDLIQVADDKVLTKRYLQDEGVPVPRTLGLVRSSLDLQTINPGEWGKFAIKPAGGAGGEGVLVIVMRHGESYLGANGKAHSRSDIEHHITEILAGIYSGGLPDHALIEECILADPFMHRLAPCGLCDIRVILIEGRVLATMLRLPTTESGGKANLHQGGIGVPISIDGGVLGNGQVDGQTVVLHPDSGLPLEGLVVPNWDRILDVARQAHRAVPLGYIGVDVCVDEKRGPLVLEVNARPGLEIQNVHGEGLKIMNQRLLEGPDLLGNPAS